MWVGVKLEGEPLREGGVGDELKTVRAAAHRTERPPTRLNEGAEKSFKKPGGNTLGPWVQFESKACTLLWRPQLES